MEIDPVKEVLEDEFLLGEIIHRVCSSKSFVKASSVSRFWLAVASGVPDLFLKLKKQSFLGFIVETQDPAGRSLHMIYPGGGGNNETVLAMRAGYDHGALGQPPVIATSGALALQSVENNEELPSGYHVSCPFSRPEYLRYVGSILPKIPKQLGGYTANTFGQYGLLMRTGKRVFSPMGFFIKEPAGPFAKLYQGIRFGSRTPVYVHVSIFRDAVWTRFVSHPINLESVVTFHRNPYCVLVGDRMFMMYLVGLIVCFNIDSCTFSSIALPDGLGSTSTSWFDYTVTKGPDEDLALVHLSTGVINRWILPCHQQNLEWVLESSYVLVAAPIGNFNVTMQSLLILGAADSQSVQIRGASEGARFVILTFGMNQSIFVIDMEKKTSLEVPNVSLNAMMGRVFSVGESWPPNVWDGMQNMQ